MPASKNVISISLRRCFHVDLLFVVEYADLAIVDLSKVATEEGRTELTEQIRRAMHEVGYVNTLSIVLGLSCYCRFFYVINHGYTAEQVSEFSSHFGMSLIV